MESPTLTFDRQNGERVLKVFGWTMAAAIVALVLDLINFVTLPAEYAFVVPLVNTVLYAVKEFLTEQTN